MGGDDNGLGRAIAAAREERGWKRKDLVAEAGISYPFLAEVENGNKRPSMGKLEDIARALDMTTDALMGRARLIDERFGSDRNDAQPSGFVHEAPEPDRLGLTSRAWEVDRPEPTQVEAMIESVMRALEPRLRELIELEVRRQLDRQWGGR